jgi:hypothetical protein
MQERDSVPARSGARSAVDERNAGGVEAGELALEVVGAIRDVVQSRAAALQEPSDGRVGPERLDQLDAPHEGDANALGVEDLGWGTGSITDEFEGTATRLDGVDGDAHVVERLTSSRNWVHGRTLWTTEYSDKEHGDGDE